ncbi:hypothetical protein F4810DRAFT_694165 [Camillea tinctor]|nr:hypothetical protein F4810DRAFT_694165 [Camillea tinctor]
MEIMGSVDGFWFCCQCACGPQPLGMNLTCPSCGTRKCSSCSEEYNVDSNDKPFHHVFFSHGPQSEDQSELTGQQENKLAASRQVSTVLQATDKVMVDTFRPDQSISHSDDSNEVEDTKMEDNRIESRESPKDISQPNIAVGIEDLRQKLESVGIGKEVQPLIIATYNAMLDDIRTIGMVAAEGKDDDSGSPISIDSSEESWSSEPVDGSGAQSARTQQSWSGVRKQPVTLRKGKEHPSSNKGKRESSSKTTASETSSTPGKSESRLACHFAKLDPILYADCTRRGFKDICKVGVHIREFHGKHPTCPDCGLPFTSCALESHINGGDCQSRLKVRIILRDLTVSKVHNVDPSERWFWIWDHIFLEQDKPYSPYWEPINHSVLGCIRSGLQESEGLSLSPEQMNLVLGVFRDVLRANFRLGSLEGRSNIEHPAPTQTTQNDGEGLVAEGLVHYEQQGSINWPDLLIQASQLANEETQQYEMSQGGGYR